MQYLTFRMNGVEYAVDVRIVETVVERCAVTAIPSPVSYMKGVMDLRGRVIPVIDLRRKFGLNEEADSSRACIIVIAVGDGENRHLAVGALVDEVSEVVDIADDRVEASKAESAALWERYVRGVVRLEERMIVVIEADALFSLREVEALRTA